MTRSDDWAASKKKLDLAYIVEQWKRETPWGILKQELDEINSHPRKGYLSGYWWRRKERRRAYKRYLKRLEHQDFVEAKEGV